jgi:hypothetical protein
MIAASFILAETIQHIQGVGAGLDVYALNRLLIKLT